jgi:cyclo(L-tyrosyl-L-tyrosyl) synthase
MEMLFSWTRNNFNTFDIFTMDEASKYTLMATGYEEGQAIKKAKKHDRNLYNKIITCLKNIGFSEEDAKGKILSLSRISKDKKYVELYKRYSDFFEKDPSFKDDCINASKNILMGKVEEITSESLSVAIQYLLLELPIWFNIPDILGISSSVLIYKDLPFHWRNICYNYGFLSPNQQLLIKDITA